MVGISDKVKSSDVKTLMEMGFSKPVSEKALFMTGNKGVEKAMDWTGAHMDDEDYEEELFMVGEQPNVKAPSNLSLEERIAKSKEL